MKIDKALANFKFTLKFYHVSLLCSGWELTQILSSLKLLFQIITKEKSMTSIITKTMAFISAYGKKDDGATAIEYGLIAAFVALVIIAGLTAFGTQLNTFFQSLADTLAGTGGGAGGGA